MISPAFVATVDHPAGAPTLFFIHGWPDDGRLWDRQVSHLRSRFRCVTINLPGYGRDDGSHWLGYSMREVTDMIAVSIGRSMEREVKKKVIIVCHDWGAVFGFSVQHKFPDLVEKVIALDVGRPPSQLTLKDYKSYIQVGIVYQYWLIMAYFISLVPLVGNAAAMSIVNYFKRSFFRPAELNDVGPITARSSYLYFSYHYEWLMVLLKFRKPFTAEGKIGDGVAPTCPCLYMYAAKKAFQFHGKTFEDALKKRSDCKVVPIPSGNHWFMVGHAETVNKEIDSFLGSPAETTKPSAVGKSAL